MTLRAYLDDPYLQECDAVVVALAEGWCRLSQTILHPGGGGQPHDYGTLLAGSESLRIEAVREDADGEIWHRVIPPAIATGERVQLRLDWPLRFALMRHHALMHIVNTVALRQFGGVMTGAQLGAERSRIDFRFERFSRDDIAAFEHMVNDVIAEDRVVTSRVISEREFRARPELLRTLNKAPPATDGSVRIVDIVGFDAQACGGTHVHSTREIGKARLEKFDNKGKENKRLYWTLSP
jgi:misacylated tRNA(Ala) deacylase